MKNEIKNIFLIIVFLISRESICFAAAQNSIDMIEYSLDRGANDVVDNIDYRMSALRVTNFNPAGDDKKSLYGLWSAVSIGKASYKSRYNISTNKIKERSNGRMFGSDIKVDDRYTIGACAALGKGFLKSSGHSGVTNIKTTVFGLYGDAMIAPNVAVIASVYVGKLRAKNHNANSTEITRNGRVIGVNLGGVYYKPIVGNIMFSPAVGVSFNQVKLKKSGAAKVVINGLTTEKVSVYTGFSLSKSFYVGDSKIIPEISTRVAYSPIIKSGQVMFVESTGQAVAYQPNVSKAEKTRYSAAIGINIVNQKMVTLNLSYKRDWQSRYSSDTGFAKLRFNF